MANSKIRKSVKTNREVYNRLIRKKERRLLKSGIVVMILLLTLQK